jgi:hypothetical protein
VLPGAQTTRDINTYLAQIDELRKDQPAAQAGAQQDDKKRIDLLTKQNETLEKMIRLSGGKPSVAGGNSGSALDTGGPP